jgi:hypothetical protein
MRLNALLATKLQKNALCNVAKLAIHASIFIFAFKWHILNLMKNTRKKNRITTQFTICKKKLYKKI